MDEFCYVARKPCGCIVGACTDNRSREHAKYIAEWFRAGLILERVTVEDVRTGKWAFSGCEHDVPKEKQMDMFGEIP